MFLVTLQEVGVGEKASEVVVEEVRTWFQFVLGLLPLLLLGHYCQQGMRVSKAGRQAQES